MLKAYIKPMNLPKAPEPTKGKKYDDPREIEHWINIAEHRSIVKEIKNKGGRPPVWTEGKTNKLKRLYNEGLSVKKIAQEIAINEQTTRNKVCHLIKKGELERRVVRLSEADKDKIMDLYKHGMQYKAIAKQFHCTDSCIGVIIRQRRNDEK